MYVLIIIVSFFFWVEAFSFLASGAWVGWGAGCGRGGGGLEAQVFTYKWASKSKLTTGILNDNSHAKHDSRKCTPPWRTILKF